MNSKTTATVCGLYTRVSSRNQADADYSSLETQRERLEAYCRSQEDYAVYRVYEDGGYSADSLERPALKELLRDVRDGRINCVLSYKIDRLTRSVKDFHALMDVFDRFGVKFVSVTQSLDTQNPMGRLLRNILLDFAQFEREMTADRTRDKMFQRAQKGLWNGGHPPYGYLAENKRLIVHADEAERVRFMFRRFADSPSLARLRSELHQRGWYTRSGQQWSKTAIDQILRNPMYCGVIRFHQERFRGAHEALIDESLFGRVQSVRRERSHSDSRLTRTFLLKGLVKCAACGSWMTPHYTQKRRADGSLYRIPYYRCSKTMHFSNAICPIKSINANQIEGAVIQQLSDLAENEAYVRMSVADLNQDLKRKTDSIEAESGQIKRRLNEIEEEIGRYVKALGKGTISIERLEAEISTLEGHRRSLQSQYADLQRKGNEAAARDYNADLLRRTLQDFRAAFDGLTPPEQSEALQCVIKGITVDRNKLDLEIFELEEFQPGSQNRKGWLLRLDSNQQPSG